jgi:hypothetical protein
VAWEASDSVRLADRFPSIIGGIKARPPDFCKSAQGVYLHHGNPHSHRRAGITAGAVCAASAFLSYARRSARTCQCSLVFETEPPTAEIMRQPPRNDITLFGRRELLLSLAQGIMILTTAFSIYYGLFHFGYEVTEARTVAVALL